MTNRLPSLAAAALFAMSIAPFANVASAMPVADALAIKNTVPTNIETVYWRGRGWGWGGRGWGWGVGAGLVGGALVAGALTAPYYYGSPAYYGYPGYYGNPAFYGPGYYPAPGYVVSAPGAGGDAVAYCMQRFRSYDPRSGTYLGNDGMRHPCP